MREREVEACAMEVSSHALAMGRVDGVVFDVAVFLDLGRDHLDFHTDEEDYYLAKASLFTPERAGWRCSRRRRSRPATGQRDDAPGLGNLRDAQGIAGWDVSDVVPGPASVQVRGPGHSPRGGGVTLPVLSTFRRPRRRAGRRGRGRLRPGAGRCGCRRGRGKPGWAKRFEAANPRSSSTTHTSRTRGRRCRASGR